MNIKTWSDRVGFELRNKKCIAVLQSEWSEIQPTADAKMFVF